MPNENLFSMKAQLDTLTTQRTHPLDKIAADAVVGYAGGYNDRSVDHWSFHRRKQAARVRRTRQSTRLLEERVDRLELALGAAIATVLTGTKVTVPKTTAKSARQWSRAEIEAMLLG